MFDIPDIRRTYVIYTILVTLLTATTFGSLASHLFGTDDHEWLKEVPVAFENPSAYFSPNRQNPIRPPVDFLFALGYLAWGDNPAAFHILQVGLHLLISLLLVYTFRCFKIDGLCGK